ncbi:MAG: manganese efflux pump MntP family protein [Bacteroidales bacterium]|jgi:putative Mn2+ efflux pump MntP|nr:manganese efflux pump MntP family protein [Bacteroidales bacterium]
MTTIVIEAVLIVIANCMDTLAVSTACGLQKVMTEARSVFMALIFAVVQTLMPFVGMVLGEVLSGFTVDIGRYISFSLFVVIGLKALWEARKTKIKDRIFDIGRLSVLIMLAFATSMDALIIGLSLGLQWSLSQLVLTLVLFFIFTLGFAWIGVRIGSRLYFVKPNYALAIAGVIFILMGIKILLF